MLCSCSHTAGKLLRHAHFLRESRVRYKFGRGSRASLLKHLVDLLEGETLSLRNEQVCVYPASEAQGAPEEEDACAQIGFVSSDEVRGYDGDDLK